MHSNELADFVALAQATHAYTDAQVEKFFDGLAKNAGHEGFQQLLAVLRAYRPRVLRAVLVKLSDDGTG